MSSSARMVARPRIILAVWLSVLSVGSVAVHADDWPMWRFDSQRSGAGTQELAATLQLAWSRDLPPLQPAWPDQAKMQLDSVYEPIVMGKRLFVGSSYDDSLTCYDTRTGDERWRFYADGPIRFAPVAWRDRVLFVSDDGYLYCLRAESGEVVWKFRGGPSDRKILGNQRMISTWPARGAPVLADDTVYFAAGIWPFMGTFIHAVDVETGKAAWTNDGDGSMYIKQPHNADSFAGVAPQGPLVAIGSRLLIPGGRSVPACYDRMTGAFRYYQLAENGKKGGGSFVAASDKLIFNGGAAFDLETEKHLGSVSELFAFADGVLYESSSDELTVRDMSSSKVDVVETVDRKGVKSTSTKWTMKALAEVDSPRFTALIKSGSRLYGGGAGQVTALRIPASKDKKAEVTWTASMSGTAASLIAADDRLFVVTREGRLACFAAPSRDSQVASKNPAQASAPAQHRPLARPVPGPKTESTLSALPAKVRSAEGYGVAWGVDTGRTLIELVERGRLSVVVVEPDDERARAFRGLLNQRGVPARRMSVLVAEPRDVELPPCFASVIVAESLPEFGRNDFAGFLEKSFQSLRPYGGAVCFAAVADRREACEKLATDRDLSGAELSEDGSWLVVTRAGALPDSANWTHEHADAANSRVSKDKRVKAPLGLLWFGGSTNDGILPRHGHGPQPQVVDGRLFMEGVDMMRAMDIYTGRVLWTTKLPGLGLLYNNTAHQPGANASGSNFVSTSEGVYVAYRDACLLLDAATGEVIRKFQLPPAVNGEPAPLWGYLNVHDDYLIGGAEPVFDPSYVHRATSTAKTDDDKPTTDKPTTEKSATDKSATEKAATEKAESWSPKDNDNYSASSRLVVMNRRTGEVLWTVQARSGFRHNGVCVGGGRIYCIDRLSGPQVSKLKRRGEKPPFAPRVIALELETGKQAWSSEKDVFGTWLSYSTERDVLVESGRIAGDTLSDEPKGMRAYRARDGQTLWTNMSLSGPAMLHHDTILMAGSACDLLTGVARLRAHPLSGELMPWSWTRNYGCNTPMASEHLLTFRSGAAGYFDLLNDGGTGNFGGFRSSCTNNLVVAGGILTAPDYTRTCVCSYQNQTSIALVPVEDAEVWTSFGAQTPKEPVRRVGINLGAPGDRKAKDGTLWIEYPSVGGSSPVLDITSDPAKPAWFRRHSSLIEGDGLSWVASSGAMGLSSLEVKLGTTDEAPRRYTVRLHFAEVENAAPGDRVFGVQIQGQAPPSLAAIDVVREAGGVNRSLIKEVKDVEIGASLRIELTPSASAKLPTMLSGIEVFQP